MNHGITHGWFGSRPCLPQGDTGERGAGDTGERGAGAFGFHRHCPPPLGVGETVRGLNPIVQHFPSLQSLPTKEGLLRSRAYPTQRPVPETWLGINKCYRFFLIPLNNNFLQVLTVNETIIILQKNCKAHL